MNKRKLGEAFKKIKFPKTIRNTPWMLADQVLKMFSGLVVFFYLAQYLGPERFGQLNYTIAFVFIFFPIVQLGMFSILTRELAINKDREKEYLNTAFFMCMISATIMFVVCNLISYLLNTEDRTVILLIFIYSLSLFFKPFEVIDYYFQSQNRAKISSVAKSMAVLVTVIIKLTLIYLRVDIYIIVFSFLIEYFFISIFLSSAKLIFSKEFLHFRHTKTIVKEYWRSSLPMVFSALSLAIYSRMDQIMVKNLLSNEDLGFYSSAVKLYEGVITILFTVTVSLLPALIHLKNQNGYKYKLMLTKVFSILFWGGLCLALVVSLVRFDILNFLYGKEYLEASTTLSICFFSIGFASMGSLTSRYFTVEKQEKKLVNRTVITLGVNFFLNIVLISYIEKEGAALATLISLFVGNYVLDYFDKDLVGLVKIKNNALLFRCL